MDCYLVSYTYLSEGGTRYFATVLLEASPTDPATPAEVAFRFIRTRASLNACLLGVWLTTGIEPGTLGLRKKDS